MFWIMVVSHLLVMGTQAFTSIWLTIWTNNMPENGTYEDGELSFYLGIYGGTGAAQGTYSLLKDHVTLIILIFICTHNGM